MGFDGKRIPSAHFLLLRKPVVLSPPLVKAKCGHTSDPRHTNTPSLGL